MEIKKVSYDEASEELGNIKPDLLYAHCNVSSLKQFILNGYEIEKALFKIVKSKR